MLVVVAALVLAACSGSAGVSEGGGGSVAATVGGTDITVTEVDEAYDQRAGGPGVASELAGDESGASEENLRSGVLTTLIRTEILRQAADDQGIEVTQDDIDEQRDLLVEQLGGQEQLDQLVEQANLSEEELESNLRDQAIQAGLTAELSEEVSQQDVRTAFEEDPQNQYGPTVEVRHILTETRAQARDAIDRIEGGEDFADVARDVSTDPGSAENGGDLGEVARGATVPPFEEAAFGAEVGELVGPVQSDFGFHVIEVTDRLPASSFDEVEDEIRTQLESVSGGQAFNEYISTFVEGLDIDVDPQFGRWDAATVAVVSQAQDAAASEAPEPPLPTEVPTG